LKKKAKSCLLEAASPNSADYLAMPQNFQAKGIQNFGSFAGKCLILHNSATSLLVSIRNFKQGIKQVKLSKKMSRSINFEYEVEGSIPCKSHHTNAFS
jgi:hypothetical protein